MARIDAAKPFVLLDDARAEGAAPARLYSDPVRVVEAATLDEVPDALEALRGTGLHAAGFLSYEAGQALEVNAPPQRASPYPSGEGKGVGASVCEPKDLFRPYKPHPNPSPEGEGLSVAPLLWFGLFESFTEIAPKDVPALFADPAGAWASAPRPGIARADYDAALARVKEWIVAGDIYQANLTFQAEVTALGHPLALYAGLRGRAKAGYGGVVWTGSDWLLSLSPELFFALHDGKITTRPMKGTAPRTGDDVAVAEALAADPKQRAENLMIVDLLRNDLSRVAEPGSVAVPELFHVETYPTVHQMTSTVTARLRDGLDALDIVQNIFPCGSITGAPKIRAMEVIDAVETTPRGAYTGSIGRIDASGDAAFNVAIRTLRLQTGRLQAGESRATLGLGGGIVADSRVDEEWRECLAKGAFVASDKDFDLIETMRFDPAGGIYLLDRHIARISESARAFGFPFDRHAARNELQAASFRIASPRRVRLMLSPSGRIAIEIGALHAAPELPVPVALAPRPVARDDFRLSHKTSARGFYSEARKRAGTFEVALTDEEGFVTEGSFTNIFVKGEGALLTPPLTRGLLPGVLRAELLANGSAREGDLRAEDLADGFFVGNASRGLIAAVLV